MGRYNALPRLFIPAFLSPSLSLSISLSLGEVRDTGWTGVARGPTADWEETPEEGRGVFFFYLISEMYEAQRSIHPPPPPPLGFSKTPAPCPFFHRDLSLPLPFRSPRGINTPPIVLTRDPLPRWDGIMRPTSTFL